MDPLKNFAFSTVATAPSPATSGTSLVLASGEGTRFPLPSSDGPFNVVVFPAGAQPSASNAEILRVGARSSDTISSLTRAQEGTGARTIVVGDQVILAATAKAYTDIYRRKRAFRPTNPSGGARALYETYPRQDNLNVANVSVLASQRIQLVGIEIPNGETLTGITFLSGVTALSGGNHQIFALLDDYLGSTSGTPYNVLSITTDDTNTAWAGATPKPLAFTPGTYTTKRDNNEIGYYLGILVDATTPPTLHCMTAGAAIVASTPPVFTGTSDTGRTSFPAACAAPTSVTNPPYAWVY